MKSKIKAAGVLAAILVLCLVASAYSQTLGYNMTIPYFSGSPTASEDIPLSGSPTSIYFNTTSGAQFDNTAGGTTFAFVFANYGEPNQDAIEISASAVSVEFGWQSYYIVSVLNSSETASVSLTAFSPTYNTPPPDVYLNITALGDLAVWQSGHEYTFTGITGLASFSDLVITQALVYGLNAWTGGSIYLYASANGPTPTPTSPPTTTPTPTPSPIGTTATPTETSNNDIAGQAWLWAAIFVIIACIALYAKMKEKSLK
jgi:hypothetical protein